MYKIIANYYIMPKYKSLEAEYTKKKQQVYDEFEKMSNKNKELYKKTEAKRVKAIYKKLGVLEKKRDKLNEKIDRCEIIK